MQQQKMRKTQVACCFLALLAAGHLLAAGREGETRHRMQSPAVTPYVPWVEVSQVTVDPAEIHLTRAAGEESASAIVTVQLFHQALASEHTVDLELGTYKIDPPSPAVSVSYD